MNWPLLYLSSVLIFWASLFYLLYKWPRVSNKSISRHAASQKDSYIFFTLVQIIVGIAALLFMHQWFIRQFSLSLVFAWAIYITIGLQLLSAVLPDTQKGLVSLVHLNIASLMAVGIFVSSSLLAFTDGLSLVPRIVFAIAALYMAHCIALLLTKKGKPELFSHYLLLQVIYVVSFQAAILFATYYK